MKNSCSIPRNPRLNNPVSVTRGLLCPRVTETGLFSLEESMHVSPAKHSYA